MHHGHRRKREKYQTEGGLQQVTTGGTELRSLYFQSDSGWLCGCKTATAAPPARKEHWKYTNAYGHTNGEEKIHKMK